MLNAAFPSLSSPRAVLAREPELNTADVRELRKAWEMLKVLRGRLVLLFGELHDMDEVLRKLGNGFRGLRFR